MFLTFKGFAEIIVGEIIVKSPNEKYCGSLFQRGETSNKSNSNSTTTTTNDNNNNNNV